MTTAAVPRLIRHTYAAFVWLIMDHWEYGIVYRVCFFSHGGGITAITMTGENLECQHTHSSSAWINNITCGWTHTNISGCICAQT